ncbi:MAG: c-type cytochrome [Gammaproteobacteria bacterium]|nr:c-type cytochrome [Gammaproteobacteria bacterium]
MARQSRNYLRAVLSTIAADVSTVAAVLACAPLLADPGTSPLAGDPQRGKALYQACSGCHSIDDDDIGPRHRGVVGRRAGSVAEYAYSPALKASGLTWDAATLDRWLTNPQALVPGTKMYFSLADPQQRADIIAYLQLQH